MIVGVIINEGEEMTNFCFNFSTLTLAIWYLPLISALYTIAQGIGSHTLQNVQV